MYYNNSIISGAIYDTIIATQSGLYYVSVTDNNTCIDTSNHIIVYPLSTETINFEKAIKVYPNPSNGIFKIETNIQNITYAVIDITGKILSQGKVTTPIYSIDLSHYSNGIYFLKVGLKVFKLIKT